MVRSVASFVSGGDFNAAPALIYRVMVFNLTLRGGLAVGI